MPAKEHWVNGGANCGGATVFRVEPCSLLISLATYPLQATNSRKHKRRLITPDQASFDCAASTIDSAWFRHNKIGFSVGTFHFKVNPVPIGAQPLGNEMKTIGHGHA